MLNESDDPQRESDHDDPKSADSGAKSSRLRLGDFVERHLTKKWLAILLAISILGHGVGFAAFCYVAQRQVVQVPDKEVSLGTFRFDPAPAEGNPVVGAEFKVYVVPLVEIDTAARLLLEEHRHRIRGDIQELLRKAHGGDFRDPALLDLKRQLQEQINEALGVRAVAEVVVADLTIQRPAHPLRIPTETAGTTPTPKSIQPAG